MVATPKATSVPPEIRALAAILDARAPFDTGHQGRVAQLAVTLGQRLKLDAEALARLELAASLHDIGNIGVPAEILARPAGLGPEDRAVVQTHCAIGAQLLAANGFAPEITAIVAQHHERLDGSGYPQGLRGDQIAPEARILGVADVVVAMGSHRPHRPARPGAEIAAEIDQGRGSRYDTAVVEACAGLIDATDRGAAPFIR